MNLLGGVIVRLNAVVPWESFLISSPSVRLLPIVRGDVVLREDFVMSFRILVPRSGPMMTCPGSLANVI